MGRFGGYYKGEKKKSKKVLEKKPSSFSAQGGPASGWRLPEIIGRGKKSE